MFSQSSFQPIPAETITTSCALCGSGCRIRVITNPDGTISAKGDRSDAVSGGQLCRKGMHSIDLMNHPDRLTQPLKRTGKRGEGQWQAISWKEAIAYTAEQFAKSQQQWGLNSVFMAYGYSKDFMYTQLLRLANAMGSVNVVGPETVCWAPTKLGREYTLGYYPSHDINEQTQCILLWGVNKYKTRFSDVKTLKTAMGAGAKTICIDPQRTKHAKKAEHWLALKPGSDLALALALLKVIIDEQLYDHEFVEQWCEGFERLTQHLAQYELAQLAQETQLDIDQIRSSARLYASTKPAVIITGNALDHNSDSFQVNRTIAMLMAITGNLDVPGGQFQSHAPSLVSGRWPYDDKEVSAMSADSRATSAGTPVLPEYFRATSHGITKAILGKGDQRESPIKAGLVVGANPMLSWPDTHAVHQALSSLDFLAVSELFMTPTAMMADIVFPAASFMEYEAIAQGLDGSVRYQPKVAQIGECRPDHQIIAAIGEAMEVMPPHSENEYWNGFLATGGLDFATVKAKQLVTPPTTPQWFRKYLTDGFPTRSGKVELFSRRLEEMGAEPLPVFRPVMKAEPDFPLALTTAKAKHYMFSHGRQIAPLRKAHPEPLVSLHPETAKKLGLSEGKKVKIETPNGRAITQVLQLDSKLSKNVAIADLSWWYPEQGESNLGGVFESNYNVLTSIEDNGRGFGEAGSFDINGLACRISACD
ncbi:molybdopterin-containing oxidoreductase family protein [Photobacterium sp. J15]|uniref:molybdopterin-containing oxidoreductase family protein n=1 Tax=Photobacterium sp. J15 TaxID=265901 RepID=UPI0007E3E789|nr:molybdopterin-dependent oxidoreductase [Photobacterium sp. J15]